MELSIFQKVAKQITFHSPTILTGLGVAGLVSTTIMAVRATPKALDLIIDYEESNNKIATPKEIIKITWKGYAPAIVMGGVTIGCIIFANKINLRRNAALASVYSLSELALKEYKDKVVTEFGKGKAQKIKDEIIQDHVDKHPISTKEVIITGNGDTLCYDNLTGRYFKSNIEKINKALNEASKKLLTDDFVSLNEVYYELGLQGTKLGNDLGWFIGDGKIIEPDWGSCLTDDGLPCVVLDYLNPPKPNYIDY